MVRCRDEELTHGARCPHDGCRGKLYDTKQPAIFIRLTGQPLVGATRYEQEVLRCSACQERFTAPLPAGVKPEKYDRKNDSIAARRRCDCEHQFPLPPRLAIEGMLAFRGGIG